MKSCCIKGCDVSKTNVTLFEFPTSRVLRKRWLDAISARSELAVVAISARSELAADGRICSQHFSSKDYEDIRGKIRLKSKVVPSMFGDKALNPGPPQDPLGLPDSTAVDDSQEHSTPDKQPINNDNLNGKVDNNSEKVDYNSDHQKDKKYSESPIKDATEKGHSETVTHDGEKLDNECEKVDNKSEKVDNEFDKVDNECEKVDECEKGDNKPEKVDNECEKVDNEPEKLDNECEKVEECEKVDNKPEKVDNECENVDTKSEKVDNECDKVDKDGGNVDYNKKIVQKVVKKAKKKWVPMRNVVANRNGHSQMSEDSSSQDSVNSDLPPAPLLEDLEEHLPNYQIANMKTERQRAAMAETVDPVEETTGQDLEEVPTEAHEPVFIELSVGQDSELPDSEHVNDCLMVLESVQCDIDPTLMLEARAEDDECCEQIDIDDDDDDDDDVVMEPDDAPPADKATLVAVDPISLLTSSDEDDVILQEPHIDTLSVSDETDEDDVPLQTLLGRGRAKTSKHKKTPKQDAIKNILVASTDYYCMHCRHVSDSSAAHRRHLRAHRAERDAQSVTTRVYQICKECGFTTSSKAQLHRHQRKHLNEKRFKCPLCSYRSKYNMSLAYHLKTHDYEPDAYTCGACGRALRRRAALKEHQATCSAARDQQLCGLCGFVSPSKRAMRTHRNMAHKRHA